MARLGRRLLIFGLAVVVVLGLIVPASGYALFTRARVDPLQRADVIIVLGGEHDGREAYGMSLARQGWAPTVLLSDPYYPGDPLMRRACRESGDGIEVICFEPDPLTTRGEAEMTHRLAVQRSWHKFIVISWRYHLPRAKFIFEQCFSRPGDVLVMRDVPRPYDLSLLSWEYVYLYQYAGLVKAAAQRACV